MRIIGLPKLIKDEASEEICLKNCPLVVDGHSFFYNSYEASKIPYIFGADAKEYARYLRVKTLLKFKRANIKCYFVFRGGDNDINEKIAKIKTTKFDFESNNNFVPPVFMREIALQILEETGINYTTCIAGNTDDCVALAQALNCPILSSNIEYCFRKVPYILSASLKYSHPNNYIMCKQYAIQNFLKQYILTEKKFAIFLSLSDSQVFELNRFVDLLKNWDVTNESLYEQNKNLLKWLSEHSEDEALSAVSNFLVDTDENEKFLNHIQQLLDKKSNVRPSIATDYLYYGLMYEDLPWFELGVASQKIAIPYINLYKYKLLKGSSAIERKGGTDSIMLSMDIIVYAYNLLTNFQKSQIILYQDAENKRIVNTTNYNIRKPNYRCVDSVFENGWDDVKRMKLFNHFLEAMKIKFTVPNIIPYEGRIFFYTLAYFGLKKHSEGVDITKEVYSFIIYFSVSHKLRLYDLHKTDAISQKEHENILQVTEKYFKLEENEERELFDGDKLKTLVELQYCLLHMNYLNVLCGSPHAPSKYHRCINGPFVFKLLCDMEGISADLFVQSLFQSIPCVLNSVNMLINCYKTLLGPVDNWRIK